MGNKVLVIATTFPRWANDTTPGFVHDLSARLAGKYGIIVLAPHYRNARKRESMDGMDVRRFAYFKPESMQKLCYDGGIIPNMKKSFLARLQMPLLLLSEFFSAYRTIKKENIGIIHAHWMLPQGFVGAFLKRIVKKPLIVTVHGSDLFPLKSGFFKKLQRFTVKNSDIVTVNTEATKKELSSRFPEYASKIRIIPMGVDTRLFKKTKLKKPKKYSRNKLLLTVGRLSDQKGLQYLIGSMHDLLKYDKSIKLLIIGEGSYRNELEQKIKDNGLEKNVEFLGALPIKEIAKYHNYADIFVMPSLATKTGTEALGLSMIEAMSSGCAVIATSVGGIPYALKNEFNGLLVRERDSNALSHAVIRLLKSPKTAGKLGKNAAIFARDNYSWEKVAKDFLKIYDGIK